jgi:hypothetical protein
MLRLTGKYGTNLNALDGRVFDNLSNRLCNLFTGSYNEFACRRMNDIMDGYTTEDALIQR